MTGREETGAPAPSARGERATAGVRLLQAAVDNVVDAIVIVDENARIRWSNRAAVDLLRRSGPDTEGLALVHPDDRNHVLAALADLVSRPGARSQVEFRVETVRGWMPVEAVATNLLGDPDVQGVVVSFRDLTHLRAVEQLTTHDPLTGLVNRTLLDDRLSVALARSTEVGGSVAVLFVDLDDFKVINDSLGHGVGDQLLVRVGERLREEIGPTDTVARFGGDEFVVVRSGLTEVGEATDLARRLIERLGEAFVVGGVELHVGASVGVALSDAERDDPAALLRDADAAMYQAKLLKRTYHVVTPELRLEIHTRLEVERDLRMALDRGELVVHYQPIIDVRTGTVVELEALVRWLHPSAGLLLPAAFIGVAEQSGLIERLDSAVLTQISRDLDRLAAAGREDLRVAFNLAARQLGRADLVEQLQEAIGRPGSAERLTLEINEHALSEDLDRWLGALSRLRAGGFRVAIDDFGIGRTSLAHLADLPVDVIKIDQFFVRALRSGSRQRAILATLIQLAHALDVPIVGEGVETEDQRAALAAMGCDRLQGFLLGRPGPIEHLLLPRGDDLGG